MFEYAKIRQRDLERAASQYRLAASLPRRHSWQLGRYRLTFAKSADRQLHSSGAC